MGARQFFKGLTWLLVLNLLIKPAWIFVIDRRVQNIVGHDAYGSYFALYNLTYVLLFLSDAGLSNMLTQRLSAKDNIDVRHLLKVKFLLLLLYALACVLTGSLTGISQWQTLVLLVAAQGLNSLFLFLRRILAAQQLFKTDAFLSVLDKTLLLLFCIGPVYGLFFRITIPLFLQLQVLSTSVAILGVLVLLLKKKAFTTGEKLAAKKIVRWITPFMLILLLMAAHNRLDAFLLERLHPAGAREAGIYATAFRLLDAANMVGYLTASFLVPFLARHQHNRALVQQVLLFSRHGLVLVSAAVVAFVFQFAPWLQALLYHTQEAYNSRVMVLCLAALPAYYFIHVYSSALTAMAHFGPLIKWVMVFALANALLNVWLIPSYGALGCCTAALATQYGLALALWLVASGRLGIAPAAGSAVLYPVAAGVCTALFFVGQKLTGNVWIILSSIALLGFAVLLWQRTRLKKLFLSLVR